MDNFTRHLREITFDLSLKVTNECLRCILCPSKNIMSREKLMRVLLWRNPSMHTVKQTSCVVYSGIQEACWSLQLADKVGFRWTKTHLETEICLTDIELQKQNGLKDETIRSWGGNLHFSFTFKTLSSKGLTQSPTHDFTPCFLGVFTPDWRRLREEPLIAQTKRPTL